MNVTLVHYVTSYGYLAIFTLVFLQELGVPNPVPNEAILIFSGYLASIDTLNFWYAIGTAIAADFIGTSVLYFIFYFFGHTILRKKPRWLPIKEEQLTRASNLFAKHNIWGIYLGRLLPYVRGYTSVGAGIFQIKPRIFLPMVFLSALTWSGGYVLVGKLLGPRWEKTMNAVGGIGNMTLILVGLVAGFFIYKRTKKYFQAKAKNQIPPQSPEL